MGETDDVCVRVNPCLCTPIHTDGEIQHSRTEYKSAFHNYVYETETVMGQKKKKIDKA